MCAICRDRVVGTVQIENAHLIASDRIGRTTSLSSVASELQDKKLADEKESAGESDGKAEASKVEDPEGSSPGALSPGAEASKVEDPEGSSPGALSPGAEASKVEDSEGSGPGL
jgi:hypothetical protein